MNRRLVRSSLRGLERIQFGRVFLGGRLQVGGHVATAKTPLGARVGERDAELTGREFLCLLAAITLLNDSVAFSAVELTTILGHEGTLNTLFQRCTKHDNHILPGIYQKIINDSFTDMIGICQLKNNKVFPSCKG